VKILFPFNQKTFSFLRINKFQHVLAGNPALLRGGGCHKGNAKTCENYGKNIKEGLIKVIAGLGWEARLFLLPEAYTRERQSREANLASVKP